MAMLVRSSGHIMAVDAIEYTLGQGEVSERCLRELQAALVRTAEANGFHAALRGERAWLHQFYLMARSEERRVGKECRL